VQNLFSNACAKAKAGGFGKEKFPCRRRILVDNFVDFFWKGAKISQNFPFTNVTALMIVIASHSHQAT
jgi:hypothetical protein